MIQQTNSPIWQELIDEGEFSDTKQVIGPSVYLHGKEVGLSIALDELASAMKTLEMVSTAVKELQASIKPVAIELGGFEDDRIIAKVRKGAEVTDHESAVLSHVSDGYADAKEMMVATINYGSIAWAKVSKALDVPKATLGRHTEPAGQPTVSFKLKEQS